jgi:hypothetical protein
LPGNLKAIRDRFRRFFAAGTPVALRAEVAAGRTIRQIVKELQVQPQSKKTRVDVGKNWIDRA